MGIGALMGGGIAGLASKVAGSRMKSGSTLRSKPAAKSAGSFSKGLGTLKAAKPARAGGGSRRRRRARRAARRGGAAMKGGAARRINRRGKGRMAKGGGGIGSMLGGVYKPGGGVRRKS